MRELSGIFTCFVIACVDNLVLSSASFSVFTSPSPTVIGNRDPGFLHTLSPNPKPAALGREAPATSRLTIRNQVLRDVEGDLDDERAADMRGAHEADDTAGDADQHQGGLVDGTPGRTH